MQHVRAPSAPRSSSFEEGLEIFQLTAGAARPAFEGFEGSGSVLRIMRFPQGAELRLEVPAGRLVVGSIVENEAPVFRNGAAWLRNDALAFLRGTIDVCTHAASVTAWLETDASSLGLPERLPGEPEALRFHESGGSFGIRPPDRDPVRHALRSVTRGLRWATPSENPGCARYDFARYVEGLMWQNVDSLLSLESISKLTSRSPRSVHYAFSSSFGFGPLSYFKILRLNAVRKWLLDPKRTGAVIDIAAEYGFWHLGHFGTSYRHFFGETPSQTRRRAASRG